MALTIGQLAAALRLTADASMSPPDPLADILQRHMDAATALIDKRTTDTPNAVRDEATVRLCGYWYDAPFAPAGDRFMAAWRYSGAASLLAPWTIRRTGISEPS